MDSYRSASETEEYLARRYKECPKHTRRNLEDRKSPKGLDCPLCLAAWHAAHPGQGAAHRAPRL